MANKNNKGLGRGIDAIFKDFESPDLSANNTVEELPLIDIRPNPYQPRKTFDEEGLKELAGSIKQTGVPVNVASVRLNWLARRLFHPLFGTSMIPK